MIDSSMMDHMFVLTLPLAEKLARPVIVYLALVVLLRIFGKRELAQLNPFDLVVLMSLSNTVQNSIIGDDNSVSGGLIGAVGLLAINWLLVRFLYRSRRLTHAVEGGRTLLIHNGQVDLKALKRETLTQDELLDVIHRNGYQHFSEIRRCELEPNGTFFVEALEPTIADKRHQELVQMIAELRQEVSTLKASASDLS